MHAVLSLCLHCIFYDGNVHQQQRTQYATADKIVEPLASTRFYSVILWLHHVLRTCNFITGALSSRQKSCRDCHTSTRSHERRTKWKIQTKKKKKLNWTEAFVLRLKYSRFRYNKALEWERPRSASEKNEILSGLSSIFFSFLSSFTYRLALTAFVFRYLRVETLCERRWFSWVAS